MALEKIFVAYDGSDHSKRALEMAKNIAILNSEIKIDIINVAPIPALSGMQTENLAEIIDMMIEDSTAVLHEAQDIMEEIDEQITTYLLKGASPAVEIMKMIDAGDYDLAIVGSRGLSGIREFMGSVSYKVLHEAKIPVMVTE
ncbi:MAG: universal stress protein [Raoultibacter sp.]|jgi:nucleotide-binding universal stress UspA family protein